MYSLSEIQQVIDALNKHYGLLMINILGVDSVNEFDRLFLLSQGVNIDDIKVQFPDYMQMYLLGRLTSILKDEQIRQLEAKDFEEYLNRGQFVPLSPFEKRQYEYSREKTYNHLKGLANKITGETRDILLEENKKQIISEEISEGVNRRLSIKKVVSNLGHRTGEWERDWERIVRTEMQDIFNQGRASEYIEKYGVDSEVYKDVYEGACRHCIRLYLTNGLGSKPRVFKIVDLINNGTNIGRKVADWLPVVGPTHPYCRCHLRHKDKAKQWNEDLGRWEFKQDIERKVISVTKTKVYIGDKMFEV